MVLNTSLNRRGMPIVETPQNAIDLFLACGLDAFVIENLIVTKVETPVASVARRRMFSVKGILRRLLAPQRAFVRVARAALKRILHGLHRLDAKLSGVNIALGLNLAGSNSAAIRSTALAVVTIFC